MVVDTRNWVQEPRQNHRIIELSGPASSTVCVQCVLWCKPGFSSAQHLQEHVHKLLSTELMSTAHYLCS